MRGSVYDEDTKCYVVVLQRNERIIVSFRGTSNITHGENCNCFKQQPIDWLNLDAILAREGMELFSPPLVHSGFKDMFLNVQVKLIEILKNLIENENRKSSSSWHIFLTGHSLGVSFTFLCFYQGYLTSQISSFFNMFSDKGALATITSLEISQLFYKHEVVVYTLALLGLAITRSHIYVGCCPKHIPCCYGRCVEQNLFSVLSAS